MKIFNGRNIVETLEETVRGYYIHVDDGPFNDDEYKEYENYMVAILEQKDIKPFAEVLEKVAEKIAKEYKIDFCYAIDEAFGSDEVIQYYIDCRNALDYASDEFFNNMYEKIKTRE